MLFYSHTSLSCHQYVFFHCSVQRCDKRQHPNGPNRYIMREVGLLLHRQYDAVQIVSTTPSPSDGDSIFRGLFGKPTRHTHRMTGIAAHRSILLLHPQWMYTCIIFTSCSTYCIYHIQCSLYLPDLAHTVVVVRLSVWFISV